MNHDAYDEDYIADILKSVRRIAMIGASANTVRPSYFVLKYLLAKGYTVIPVNPGLAGQQLLGRDVMVALADVAAPVHMVDIFRNSDAALDIVREAITLKDKLSIQVIWMQLGVLDLQAAERAECAGLTVVMDRCPKIEWRG